MPDATLLSWPTAVAGTEERLSYRVSARPKSRFKTVIDASGLFAGDAAQSEVVTTYGAEAVTVSLTHQLAGGTLAETLHCARVEGGLRAATFTRTLDHPDGRRVRTEEADFADDLITLPTMLYPETVLPFLLRYEPSSKKQTKAVYAWTTDRFIARVYFELRKRVSVDVPAGRFDADLVWLYPDLNDWIAMGAMLTKLAKPLIPRYTLWFESAAPRRLLRFEGPYGPPGAPELILELA